MTLTTKFFDFPQFYKHKTNCWAKIELKNGCFGLQYCEKDEV